MNDHGMRSARHRRLSRAALLGALCVSMMSAHATTFNAADTAVQLFRWKWNDIATECTQYLGPKGYGAVQTSPPQASRNLGTWYDVYQPVNYAKLDSLMGTETEYRTMIDTCHAAGVRVYADVVINQMAGGSGTASDGSTWNAATLTYPYFSTNDFHTTCQIASADYAATDRTNVTTCRLNDLPDLKTDGSYVRGQVGNYLNKLIGMGIDGVRIDAAKHMAPADIAAFLSGTTQTTQAGEALWVTQEIIPDGGVTPATYYGNGTVNEFHYVYAMKQMFQNLDGHSLSQLETIMGTPNNWGGTWYFMPSDDATVFVDDWDTERGDAASPPASLVASNDVTGVTNDTSGTKRYDLANILMLAWPYGRTAIVQSGFRFTDQNQGPPNASPYDSSDNALVNQSWDFIHRWSDIANMVAFRSATDGEGVSYFTTGTANQIAFSRGAKGFVAINNDSTAWASSVQTLLPAGVYCNVVNGLLNSDKTGCTGDSVTIGSDGIAKIDIGANDGTSVPAVALYVGQRVGG